MKKVKKNYTNKNSTRIKKKKSFIKNNSFLIGFGFLCTILLIIAIVIAMQDSQKKSGSLHCEDGKVLDQRNPGTCIDEKEYKPCTVNKYGHDDCAGTFSYQYSKGKNSFDISYSTVQELGILQNNEIYTGEKYLYVDPEKSYYTLVDDSTISNAQNENKICLTAEDAWYRIGESKCVAFYVGAISYSNGIIFLNEKEEYRSGFVALIMSDFIDYETVKETFLGRYVGIKGIIESYEGHPEIKVWASRAISNDLTFVGFNNNKGMLFRL